MAKRPTILQAISDARLFKPLGLTGPSWKAWRTVLAAIYGLPLNAEAREWFCAHTGRSRYTPPPGGWKETAIITGRQSGKTQIAALIASYEAAFPLAPPAVGQAYALMVAQDQRSSQRTLLSYARSPFEISPTLKESVVRDAADTLTLNTKVSLAAYPCRPAAIRGLRAVVTLADEFAFFQTTEGNPVDTEMLRALRPTLATTGGKLIILSSPYAEAGALYDLHRKHYGCDDSATLIIQATAPELNSTLSPDYLARMEQDDPEAYRSEVLGEFRAGISTFLDPDALMACVDIGTRERLPEDGVRYFAFVDASTGGGRDKFTVAIGHVAKIGGREVMVLDCVRAWAPPFDPSAVIAEASELLRRYRLKAATGDAFAGAAGGGFVQSAFKSNGIDYAISELDRSAIYMEFLPLVNSNTVLLADIPEMLREFRGLERRRGSSGRDRVNHRPGSHDDLANAAAGVLVHMAAAKRKGGGFFLTGSWSRTTDGAVYIDGKQVRPGNRVRSRSDEPWIHPHERI